MSFRFRKSMKILPGLRLNVSKSGVSTSVGAPGTTLNISKNGTRATVGLPGSGMSVSSKLAGGQTAMTTTVKHDVVIGSSADGYSQPDETAYRLGALLASALLAGAERRQVSERIVGLFPERFPSKLTGPQVARAMIDIALAPSSTVGVKNVRAAMLAAGIAAYGSVDDAVVAVRKSNKVRLKAGGDGNAPLEWYSEDGLFQTREFEAPSLRARIPEAALSQIHEAQVQLGRARLADKILSAPMKAPLFDRIIFRAIQLAAIVILGVVTFVTVFIILSMIRT